MIGIHCGDFNLTFLPEGFLNYFPNIIGFDIGYCRLNPLNGNELDFYANLEFWASFSGVLERIPGIFFIYTKDAIC